MKIEEEYSSDSKDSNVHLDTVSSQQVVKKSFSKSLSSSDDDFNTYNDKKVQKNEKKYTHSGINILDNQLILSENEFKEVKTKSSVSNNMDSNTTSESDSNDLNHESRNKTMNSESLYGNMKCNDPSNGHKWSGEHFIDSHEIHERGCITNLRDTSKRKDKTENMNLTQENIRLKSKHNSTSKQINDVSSSDSEVDEVDLSSQCMRKKMSTRSLNSSHYFEDYPEYQLQKSNLMELQRDDEVYLLQIPNIIDPKNLQNIPISLTKKTKLKIDTEKFVIQPQHWENTSLDVYSNTLQKVFPSKCLRMEKYVKNEDQKEVIVEEKKKQSFPENIKTRHPLFGSSFELKIILNEKVKRKLNEIENSQMEKKRLKSKIKIKNESVEEDNNLLISQILKQKFDSVNKKTSRNNIKKESVYEYIEHSEGKLKKQKFSLPQVKIEVEEELINPDSKSRKMSENSLCKNKSLSVENFNTCDDIDGNLNANSIKTKKKKSKSKFNEECNQNVPEIKVEVKDEFDNLQDLVAEELNDSHSTSKKRKRKDSMSSGKFHVYHEKFNGQTKKNSSFLKQESVDECMMKNKIRSKEALLTESDDYSNYLTSKNIKREFINDYTILEEKIELVEETLIPNVSQIKMEQREELENIDDSRKRKKKRKASISVESFNIAQDSNVAVKVKTEKKKKMIVKQELESEAEIPKTFGELEQKGDSSPYNSLLRRDEIKKRRKSILNSTMVTNSDIPSFSVDVSRIDSEKPPAQKEKIKKRDEVDENLISNLLLSAKNRLESGLVKKKSKKKLID